MLFNYFPWNSASKAVRFLYACCPWEKLLHLGRKKFTSVSAWIVSALLYRSKENAVCHRLFLFIRKRKKRSSLALFLPPHILYHACSRIFFWVSMYKPLSVLACCAVWRSAGLYIGRTTFFVSLRLRTEFFSNLDFSNHFFGRERAGHTRRARRWWRRLLARVLAGGLWWSHTRSTLQCNIFVLMTTSALKWQFSLSSGTDERPTKRSSLRRAMMTGFCRQVHIFCLFWCT